MQVPEGRQELHTGQQQRVNPGAIDLHPEDEAIIDLQPSALVTALTAYTEPPPRPAPSDAQGVVPQNNMGNIGVSLKAGIVILQ